MTKKLVRPLKRLPASSLLHRKRRPKSRGRKRSPARRGQKAGPPGCGNAAEGTADPGAQPLRPAARTQSFEELIGTRWVVWVGGLALGLGGLFLVRYSIEQGWFGPGARIAAGALFATRSGGGRRMDAPAEPPEPASPRAGAGRRRAAAIPSAGHPLRTDCGRHADRVRHGLRRPCALRHDRPATAFVLLGASARHDGGGGPARACAGRVGLVGSFAAPALVSSDNPQPWPVLFYLLVVAGSAYGLAPIARLALAGHRHGGGAALWCAAYHDFGGMARRGVMRRSCCRLRSPLCAFGLLPTPATAATRRSRLGHAGARRPRRIRGLVVELQRWRELGSGACRSAGVMLAIMGCRAAHRRRWRRA